MDETRSTPTTDDERYARLLDIALRNASELDALRQSVAVLRAERDALASRVTGLSERVERALAGGEQQARRERELTLEGVAESLHALRQWTIRIARQVDTLSERVEARR